MTQRVMIYGKKFAGLRRERYLTQEEFAHGLEMSPANVRRLEQAEVSGMQVKNFRRLAVLMNIAPEELRLRIGVASKEGIGKAGDAPAAAPTPWPARPDDPAFPRALRAGTRTAVDDIELFHGVSAARIEDRTATGRGSSPVPAGSHRRFAVTVDGDCMEPRYRDGEVVVFSVDLAEREGIVDGKNYFIQFADGENTFKRVFLDPENRELLILKCWNEAYEPRAIERASVKLLARAIYKLTPDE